MLSFVLSFSNAGQEADARTSSGASIHARATRPANPDAPTVG
jgi:hypothetical protein